jgi:hypothetical protein
MIPKVIRPRPARQGKVESLTSGNADLDQTVLRTVPSARLARHRGALRRFPVGVADCLTQCLHRAVV